MGGPKCRGGTNRQTSRVEQHLNRLRSRLRLPKGLDKRSAETDQHCFAKAEQSNTRQNEDEVCGDRGLKARQANLHRGGHHPQRKKQDEAAEVLGIPARGHNRKYSGSESGDHRDVQFGFSGHRPLPSANLRRSAHFSPAIMMFSAVDVVWFVALPQTTPVPQTTLKPLLALEPQQTLLPQSTDVPFTNTFVPQTTEVSQTASVPQTTLVPVTKETLCVAGSYTAVGDAADAPARSLLDSAAAISR